jgi:prepilin-type N-terminal cleavage/methylation domain-containing protein
MAKKGGMTMIEILITLSIAAVIFAISTFSYQQWQIKVRLLNSRDELKSVLLRTQQLATAAASSTSWGIHLEADRYVMFQGDYYDENNPNNRIWYLNGAVILNASTTFANGGGGLGSNSVFGKFTGETYNTGTIRLAVPFNTSTIRTVNVAESGQIY